MLNFNPKSMESACLLSSDFPSENPLTQNRTSHTQDRYPTYQKMENGYKHRKTELKLWIKLLDILHLFPP